MATYRATRDIIVEGKGRIRKGQSFTVPDSLPVHKSAERIHSQADLEAAATVLKAAAEKERKEADAAEKKAAAAKAKADKEAEEARLAEEAAAKAKAETSKADKPKG